MYGTVRNTTNWVIVDVDPQIGKLYRRLLKHAEGIVLQRPSWAEHITIFSHHDGPKVCDIREGEQVEFELVKRLETNGNAFWYPVEGEQLDRLRTELGVGPAAIPFHLCIGYRHSGQIPQEFA